MGPSSRRVGDPGECRRRARLDVRRWSGREAPLVVEIGSGTGEARALAAAAPTTSSRSRCGVRVSPHVPPLERGGARQRPAAHPRRGLGSGAPARGQLAKLGPSSPTRGTRSVTTSGAWCRPASPPWSPTGCARAECGGWRPTGGTTPLRSTRCWRPSRGLDGRADRALGERPGGRGSSAGGSQRAGHRRLCADGRSRADPAGRDRLARTPRCAGRRRPRCGAGRTAPCCGTASAARRG